MTDAAKKKHKAILAAQISAKNNSRTLPSRHVEPGDRAKVCRLLAPKPKTNS